jgi:hypothetical protein
MCGRQLHVKKRKAGTRQQVLKEAWSRSLQSEFSNHFFADSSGKSLFPHVCSA